MHAFNPARGAVRARRFVQAMACAFLALSPVPTLAAAPQRPFTIDEMLRLQGIGPGAFTPDGKILVYVERPPVEDRPDFAMPYFWGPIFGKLMQVPADGSAPPSSLMPADPGVSRSLVSLSPDGRYVAYLEAANGILRLGVFDRTTGAVKVAAKYPQQNLVHDLTPVWIGAGRLLFSAAAEGDIAPYAPYRLRGIADTQDALRRKAWAGREPSQTVYASRADGGSNPPYRGQLVEFDVENGTSRVWGAGLYSDFRLSPDGKHVAAVQQFEKSQLPVDSLGSGWTFGRGQLVIFRLADRGRIDVDPDFDLYTGSAEWSPDGKRIGFFGWPGKGESIDGLFRVFDPATRALTLMPHTGLDLVSEREFGPPGRPMRFIWAGKGIAVAARPNPAGETRPRFTPKGVTGRDMNKDPGRFDWYLVGEGKPRNLTARFARVSPWTAGYNKAGAYLVLDEELRRLEVDGSFTSLAPGRLIEAEPLTRREIGGLTRLPFEDTVIYAGIDRRHSTAFDLVSGKALAIDLSGAKGQMIASLPGKGLFGYRDIHPRGTDLTVRRMDGGSVIVAKVNAQLADLALPTNRKVTYPGPDGRPISSCVTLPADYEEGRRYPTLIYAYPSSSPGCPEIADVQSASYGNLNVFTPHGYAILKVASPMIASREGGPMDGLVPAIDRAVDAAARAGYVDPDRLGMIGASGAGYSGLWAVGQSKRIKALVSINGISNLLGDYFDGDLAQMIYPEVQGWTGNTVRYEGVDQFGLGVSPWEDPMLYWRSSPIAYAQDIEAPILLVGSDMDGSFSSQYDDMFTALYRLRKTVDYVKYWGEAHGPASPANIRDLTTRSLAFFDRYVRESPPSAVEAEPPNGR